MALEFQVQPDPLMFGRLLIYLGTLSIERQPGPERGSRYELGAAVINLTGTTRSLPASAGSVWPGQTPMGCGLTACERHLAGERAEETLEAVAGGRYDRVLMPWVPLMAGGSDPAVIARLSELAGQEPDARRRAGLGYDLLVFAEKADDPGAWKKALEGWSMVKSQWMEETRAEGRAEGRQNTVLELIAELTGSAAPADVVEKVRTCADPAQLRAWTVAAARADSLERFRHLAGL
ncbi:MAG: hypothetical protein ACRC33_18510 [Gemmataceae bacterium]